VGTLRSLGEGGYASAFAVRSRLRPTKVGGFRPTKRVERCHGRKAVGLHILCIGYGFVLTGKAMDLHHSLLELIPGFSWANPVSMVWGALYIGILAWVGGWYIAWMHNASLLVNAQ